MPITPSFIINVYNFIYFYAFTHYAFKEHYLIIIIYYK